MASCHPDISDMVFIDPISMKTTSTNLTALRKLFFLENPAYINIKYGTKIISN